MIAVLATVASFSAKKDEEKHKRRRSMASLKTF
jgi:hypothetical protein